MEIVHWSYEGVQSAKNDVRLVSTPTGRVVFIELGDVRVGQVGDASEEATPVVAAAAAADQIEWISKRRARAHAQRPRTGKKKERRRRRRGRAHLTPASTAATEKYRRGFLPLPLVAAPPRRADRSSQSGPDRTG